SVDRTPPEPRVTTLPLSLRRTLTSRRGPSPLLVVSALLVALLCLEPPLYLVVRAADSWENALDTMLSGAALRVAWNTISLAGAVTFLGIAISLPMAWLVERSDLPGRRVIGILAALPL